MSLMSAATCRSCPIPGEIGSSRTPSLVPSGRLTAPSSSGRGGGGARPGRSSWRSLRSPIGGTRTCRSPDCRRVLRPAPPSAKLPARCAKANGFCLPTHLVTDYQLDDNRGEPSDLRLRTSGWAAVWRVPLKRGLEIPLFRSVNRAPGEFTLSHVSPGRSEIFDSLFSVMSRMSRGNVPSGRLGVVQDCRERHRAAARSPPGEPRLSACQSRSLAACRTQGLHNP